MPFISASNTTGSKGYDHYKLLKHSYKERKLLGEVASGETLIFLEIVFGHSFISLQICVVAVVKLAKKYFIAS